MKKKLRLLSLCCLALALLIFVFSFFLYHYLGPEGCFTPVKQSIPEKPLVTLLFSIWGVHFLFASVMCALINLIFFPEK